MKISAAKQRLARGYVRQKPSRPLIGLAVLFPTVIFGLYFKRVFAQAAILSIVCGEAALIAFYLKWLPNSFFLPVIWIMLITFAVYLTTHGVLLRRENMLQLRRPEWLQNRYVWLLLAIFLLAMDFWAWDRVEPVFWGVPLWVGYFIVLSALQTVVMMYLIRQGNRAAADPR